MCIQNASTKNKSPDKIPQFIVYSNNPLMDTKRVVWAEADGLMNWTHTSGKLGTQTASLLPYQCHSPHKPATIDNADDAHARHSENGVSSFAVCSLCSYACFSITQSRIDLFRTFGKINKIVIWSAVIHILSCWCQNYHKTVISSAKPRHSSETRLNSLLCFAGCNCF